VELLAKTGLRPSEALALQWQHVDFGRRRVRVRRSYNAGRIGPPKTRFGSRDVPLAPGLAQALWRARKASGVDPADNALVFADTEGGVVNRTAAYRAVRAAGSRSGVPWAGLRTLRHTCASILFRRSYNAKQVQVWLGHHSPAFTLATYVHLLPDDLPEPTFFDAIGASDEAGEGEAPGEAKRA